MNMTDLYYTLARFEEHYHYLESSFVDITRLIPLENEPDTFSPRLYELLQSVCSQVDGILNLMCEEYIPKEKPAATACEEDIPRKNKPAASAVYKVLNQEGVISSRVLTHKSRSNRKEIRPFLCDYECVFRDEEADQHENKVHDGMPKWWDAYNKSKHRLPEGYEAGSIGNTYLALAGLYVLHVMAREYPREAYAFTKKDRWATLIPFPHGSTKMRYLQPAVVEPPSEIFMSKIKFLNSG